MEERKTTFTGLGMSGSGKTNYIVGMYYVMASGEKGWTVMTGDKPTQDRLGRWTEQLDNVDLGTGKFIEGNRDDRTESFCFGLHYINKPIMSFDWIDYAGKIFKQSADEVFNEIEQSIIKSTAIYIFIDGEELCVEEKAKKIRRVRNHCSRYIQPCITTFVEHHDYMPPIVFVVTKSDLCKKYTTTEEMREILSESFSSLFYDSQAEIYITAVTLGDEIAENDYTGECDPINMEIPLFIGIHHELVRRYNDFDEDEPEEEKKLYREMVANITDALAEKSERFDIVAGDINGGHSKPFDPKEWRIN